MSYMFLLFDLTHFLKSFSFKLLHFSRSTFFLVWTKMNSDEKLDLINNCETHEDIVENVEHGHKESIINTIILNDTKDKIESPKDPSLDKQLKNDSKKLNVKIFFSSALS